MADPDPLTSSLGVLTLRRAAVTGRVYLGLGAALSVLLALVSLAVSRSGGGGGVASLIYALEAPMFAIMGSTGALMVFVSDRMKGVFEYLIAYGVRPRDLFVHGLVAAIGLGGLVLGISVAFCLAVFVGTGTPIPRVEWMAIALYSVPMTVAGIAFVQMSGMIWSSLSSPRTGINSPVGIAPMLGVAPTVLVLFVAVATPAPLLFYVLTGSAVVLGAVVLVLLQASSRLMNRERFLSPI